MTSEPTAPAPAFVAAFERAREVHARGNFAEAESAYRALLRGDGPREPVLRALVELYVQGRRPGDAIDTLVALTGEVPDSIYYYARLAALLEAIEQPDAAIAHYRRLLARQPEMAAAHYNVALLYKRAKQPDQAIAAYEEAIRLGIDRVEEVYSNLGVLFAERHDAGKAREWYGRALAANPVYVPALFNLAGLHEELGDREQAMALYERILALNPRHWASLARLAHGVRVTSGNDHLVQRLQRGVAATEGNPEPQESLYFALGKVMDDLGRYDDAFAAYRSANELAGLRHPPHDRRAVEKNFDRIIELINATWIRARSTDLKARPVFICGMFRSGSTLVEQILGAHAEVATGGELDYLPWLVKRDLGVFPVQVEPATKAELESIGNEYLSRLAAQFPGAANVTDKQPGNFLLLGLIKAIFPRARIIYTRRDCQDTCLSIYFQQLDNALTYATDPGDIVHYYRQHERLMEHWRQCLGADIHMVDYDELVRSPEPVLRRLLDFLGLPWDERCLNFQEARVQVKTASLWQVREPLHPRSSGRWKNYASRLAQFAARG